MKKIIITILVMLLFTCSILLGDTKEKLIDDKGKLAGKVTDEKGEPLSEASILLEGTKFSTQSKKDGTYTIKNIPPGKYDVICSRGGYRSKKVTGVQIKLKLTTIQNFKLTAQAVEIEGMDVVESNGDMIGSTKTSSGTTIKEGKATRGEGKETIDELLESSFESRTKTSAAKTSTSPEGKEIIGDIEEEISHPDEDIPF